MYMHTCIHAYIHTCIHAYMHTRIHAYMHTCIHGEEYGLLDILTQPESLVSLGLHYCRRSRACAKLC